MHIINMISNLQKKMEIFVKFNRKHFTLYDPSSLLKQWGV
jgi:hypothetical protein